MQSSLGLTLSAKKIAWFENGEILGGAELFSLDILETIGNNFSDSVEIQYLWSGKNKKIAEKIQELQKKLPKHITLKSEVIFLPILSKFSPKMLWNFGKAEFLLWKKIRKEKFSILYSNTVRTSILLGILHFFTVSLPPLIAFIHDYTFPKFLQHITLGNFQKIFACSYPIKTSLGESGLRSSQIQVIENGVDTKKFSKISRPNFTKGLKTVGIIGRISQWKGQLSVVKAIRRITELNPEKNISLKIFGEPSEKKEDQDFFLRLQHFVAENNLEKIITFEGFVPVQEALKKIDICIHASFEPEPFGRTPIEASASGRPVICSKMGTPQQIFTNKKNIIFFTPKDKKDLSEKILYLVNNPTEAEIIAKNAKEFVLEKFSLKKISEKFWGEVKKEMK